MPEAQPVKPQYHKPSSSVLARNTLLNFLGQGITGVSAILLLPLVVRTMGKEAFGILALALVVFGSFVYLELGLGRTTTKFVAEYLSLGKMDALSSLFWSTVIIQALFGMAFAGGFTRLLPTLVDHFNLPNPEYVPVLRNTLFLAAAAAPVVMVTSSLRGALEAAQRFDLVNYVKILVNLSNYLVPALLALLGFGVVGIVGGLLVARLLAATVYLMLCFHVIPSLRAFTIKRDFKGLILQALRYSGWVAIFNLTIPLLQQSDKYMVASWVGVGVVTNYALAGELLNGFWIIPSSIIGTVFPAFSSMLVDQPERAADLFRRATKYTLVALLPPVAFAFLFSGQIFTLWQGEAIAKLSAPVLRVLLMMLVINSVGWVPSNLLMAAGRPAMLSVFNLLQLPFHFGLSYVMARRWGIQGIATAMLIRCVMETLILFLMVFKSIPTTRTLLGDRGVRAALASYILFGAPLAALALGGLAPLPLLLASILALTCWLLFTWRVALDDKDRSLVYGLLAKLPLLVYR